MKPIQDIQAEDFQCAVEEMLLRNKSVLDILSKMQVANARVSRAVSKAVTSCGCIRIDASKQRYDRNSDMADIAELLDSHLRGQLCDNCRNIIEDELGGLIFYMTALCSSLDISLYDVILKEKSSLKTLGQYSLK